MRDGTETAGARAQIGLGALNFFMADLQAGVGPFLGVFLQGRGWSTGPIGTVMTLGGIAGMAVTAPAGAFVDRTRRKRLAVAAFGCCTILASLLVLLSRTPVVIDAWVAQLFGHGVAFVALVCFAPMPIALRADFAATLRPACSAMPRRDERGSLPATAADVRA